MGIKFSKKRTRVTEQDKAVLNLKQQRNKLKQYQRTIEQSLSNDKELAKRLLSENKRERAKILLKKKRFQDQLLLKLDGLLNSLEQMIHDIEFVQIEVQVVEGLKEANETLKKVNDVFNIKDIECILDETREGVDKQNEISKLISGLLTEEDEAAVEDELVAIMCNEMPKVPSDKIDINQGNNKKNTAVKDKFVKTKIEEEALF